MRRVQLAWTASTSGEFVSIVALGVFAYEAGGATAVGVVAVVQMVPAMLIAPVAGMLGDRSGASSSWSAPTSSTRPPMALAVSSAEASDLISTRLQLRRRTLGEG